MHTNDPTLGFSNFAMRGHIMDIAMWLFRSLMNLVLLVLAGFSVG